MTKIDLNGKWTMRDLETGAEYEANVPESNYTCLLRHGVISDPFLGMGEADGLWVGKRDFKFKREFEVTKAFLKHNTVLLCAKSLDTLCTVFVNTKKVASVKNAHVKHEIDVTDFLSEGANVLELVFKSPMNYIADKQAADPAPNASMGVDGVPHIRKPQCHFGWDWGPILPPSGIMGDICLEAYDFDRLADFYVKQTHEGNKVELEILPEIQFLGHGGNYGFKASVLHPNDKKEEVSGEKLNLTVQNPELWYPHDLSDKDEQPLYEITVSLLLDGKVVDEKSKKIGLRTITVNQNTDKYGDNFCFVVNGAEIFAKGANYIPSDSFIDRFDKNKCERLIKNVKAQNMNMIRVWGGGYYESDVFYDLCDKHGILVWQDFAFACAPYPFYNNDFLKLVEEEIDCNVKRLRNRASLALWCGNNEIEMMTIGWRLKKEYVKYTEIFFHKILPARLKKLDAVTEYIVGSPTSSKGFLKKVNADGAGDTHLWHVWHGLQPLNYYRKRYTRFCSEFGLEALPDAKTVAKFFGGDEQGFREALKKDPAEVLKSPLFMAHQKCDSGNMKMMFYASTRFKLPKTFKDMIYLSQVTQSICVEDATEHWRRNRGRCNGSLYWQLNDCWPVTSWAGIDYYGRFKALFYRTRHFAAPVSLSILDKGAECAFFVLNDAREDKILTLNYRLVDFYGRELKADSLTAQISALSAKNVRTANFKPLLKELKGNAVLYAELLDGRTAVSKKTVLFAPEKKLCLPSPEISSSVAVENDVARITLSAKFYARYVQVNLKDGFSDNFSDNFFDMMPGEEKTVTIAAQGRTAKEIEEILEVVSVADIIPEATPFKDFITRTKIRFVPMNVANWIFYHIV